MSALPTSLNLTDLCTFKILVAISKVNYNKALVSNFSSISYRYALCQYEDNYVYIAVYNYNGLGPWSFPAMAYTLSRQVMVMAI